MNLNILNLDTLNDFNLSELSAFYHSVCQVLETCSAQKVNPCFKNNQMVIFQQMKNELEFYASSRGYDVQNDFIVSKHCQENDTL